MKNILVSLPGTTNQANLLLVVSLAGTLFTSVLITGFILSRPEPQYEKNTADPVGTRNYLKGTIARLMTWIAQKKETSKSLKPEKVLEEWHKPENHAFFNESYYFNGCDLETRDRFITRISHRSYLGSRSYVFLLIDSKEHGYLALEEDVPAENTKFPSAMGLHFICEVPMKKWRLKYSGPMRRNCTHPRNYDELAYSERVHVDLDLTYETETPLFWYMRDDHPACLAGNLSQENWGFNFLKVCVKRTVDHGHYEDFGRARGTIKINRQPSPIYNFGTFRDHSWDIRRWATMDTLCILLIALEEPLILYDNFEYWYLDLTLVHMPGNVGGVERYSTGYALGNKINTPRLALVSGTSILDCEYHFGGPGVAGGGDERYPSKAQEVVMHLAKHPRDLKKGDDPNERRTIKIKMSGDTRRLIYWPDQGAFKVYEDYLKFEIEDVKTGKKVLGYGTRQNGCRVGDFDPTLGGCG